MVQITSGWSPIIPGLVLERCPCGEEVLTVVGLAETWRVDAVEVFPEGDCVLCKGKGTLRRTRELDATYRLASERPRKHTEVVEHVPCRRCDGTGRVGEPVARGMVLVNEFFMARRYYGGERNRGEAFHREHACAWAATDSPSSGDAPSVAAQYVAA